MAFPSARLRRARPLARAATVLVVAIALIQAFSPVALAAPPLQAAGGAFRVVIDAGHGGSDPGAIGPAGTSGVSGRPGPLREKDVALRLALLTGAALERRGIAVVQTRTDDRFVSLADRAALASRVGAQALLSLHLNAAPNPDAGGAEAWYGAARGSNELAGAVLGALTQPLRQSGIAVRGTRAGPELAVLRPPIPAALLELGYVSNPREAASLASDPLLGAAAEAIAGGVAAFRDALPPGAARSAAPTRSILAATGVYFVRPGDTAGAIAARFGLALDALARLNPAAALSALLPGQPVHVGDALSPVPAALAAPVAAAQPAAGARGQPRQVSLTGETYVVRPGDTLSGIALASGVSMLELRKLNALADEDLVYAGRTLRLRPARATPAPGTQRYVVRPGDTLSQVAAQLGVRPDALAHANGIEEPDLILAGKVLVVPRAGAA